MSQRDKPRLALNNNTAGVREREDANRTRVAGHLDEIQGVVANTMNLQRNGAVGFIDWLDDGHATLEYSYTIFPIQNFTGAPGLIQRGNMNRNVANCEDVFRSRVASRTGHQLPMFSTIGCTAADVRDEIRMITAAMFSHLANRFNERVRQRGAKREDVHHLTRQR